MSSLATQSLIELTDFHASGTHGSSEQSTQQPLGASGGESEDASSANGFAPSGELPTTHDPTSQGPLPPPNAFSTNAEPSDGSVSTTSAILVPLPVEWLSRWLRKPALSAMVLLTAVLLGTIIGILVRSHSNHGIIDVDWNEHTGEEVLPELRLSIGLMWTVFPALFFQAYALTTAAIIKAAAARQPFVELRRPFTVTVGAPAAKSIFLDYGSFLPGVGAVKALHYNHYVLSYSFTVMIFVSLVLTALASHLLTAADFAIDTPTTVNADYSFNELGFGARSELSSVIDSVTSTLIHAGQQRSWTTANASFIPASLDVVPKTARLEYNTTSYSALPHCRVLKQPEEFELGQADGAWQVNILDEGCRLNSRFFTRSISSFINQYIKIYNNVSCGLDAGESRFVVVAALNENASSSAFSNQTAISCTPSYSTTKGTLSISVDPARPEDPGFNSFKPDNDTSENDRPTFAVEFERQIGEESNTDPTNKIQAPTLGRPIYQYAYSLSPDTYFTGNVLETAIRDIFQACYAVMASAYLMQRGPDNEVPAVYYKATTRLIVFPPVAYVMIVILALAFVMLGWVYIYTHVRPHPSILYEGPVGLAGAAAILRNSELLELVEKIDAEACGGRVAYQLRKDIEADQHPSGWRLYDWETPVDARIGSTAGVAKFGWLRLFKR